MTVQELAEVLARALAKTAPSDRPAALQVEKLLGSPCLLSVGVMADQCVLVSTSNLLQPGYVSLSLKPAAATAAGAALRARQPLHLEKVLDSHVSLADAAEARERHGCERLLCLPAAGAMALPAKEASLAAPPAATAAGSCPSPGPAAALACSAAAAAATPAICTAAPCASTGTADAAACGSAGCCGTAAVAGGASGGDGSASTVVLMLGWRAGAEPSAHQLALAGQLAAALAEPVARHSAEVINSINSFVLPSVNPRSPRCRCDGSSPRAKPSRQPPPRGAHCRDSLDGGPDDRPHEGSAPLSVLEGLDSASETELEADAESELVADAESLPSSSAAPLDMPLPAEARTAGGRAGSSDAAPLGIDAPAQQDAPTLAAELHQRTSHNGSGVGAAGAGSTAAPLAAGDGSLSQLTASALGRAPSKAAPSEMSARTLRFRNHALERQYTLWAGAQSAKVADIVMNLLQLLAWVLVLVSEPLRAGGLGPISAVASICAASALQLLLNLTCRNWYVRHREAFTVALQVYLLAVSATVVVPTKMSYEPGAEHMAALYNLHRVVLPVSIMCNGFGFVVRFWLAALSQAAQAAMMVYEWSLICPRVPPEVAGGGAACLARTSASMLLIGWAVPVLGLWLLERRSRALFLQRVRQAAQ